MIRVVSYAINGRGMGHLVRQLAILRQVRRLGAVAGVKVEPWLLTSSEADTLARREGIPALKIPSKAAMRDAGLEPARYLAVARAWVVNALATLQPDLLLVDTFPGGSFGELVAGLEMAKKRVLVAREVRPELTDDPAWKALLPLYDRVIVPGEGGVTPRRGGAITTRGPVLLRERPELLPRAEARARLGIPTEARVAWLSAGGGGDGGAASVLPRLTDEAVAAGWHVVVAAGPLYAGRERRGPGVTWLDRYASVELLLAADVAVSAGGYNSLHELWMAGIPTVFLPQPKLADDQAARVARAVAAGWALAPGSLAEVVPALSLLPTGAAPSAAPLPPGGALDAAAAALSLVVDPADVDAARAAWSPDVLAALAGAALDPEQSVQLLRVLSPEPPSVVAHRRAIVEAAALTSPDRREPAGASPVATFLAACAAHDLPAPLAVTLVQHLSRRFPAARPADLSAALTRLLPHWARWGDWMGVVSLVRGLPTQREYPLAHFATDVARWDADLADPYEALRRLNRASDHGARPLAEVLRQPAGGDEP